jgi:bifunctional UDP-N-acetylglucosamine pyrophosphorylase / glucosamine-1-phosphate N-acetyltransferase
MTGPAVVVLAAGQGKRMVSDLPKVLHPFAGSPIVEFVLDAVDELSPARTVVVIGHQADRVRAALAGRNVLFALQAQQLGTGHAVQQCAEALQGFAGTILVLVGDVPLLRAETLSAMLRLHAESRCACTVLTAEFSDPTGYGRIVRDSEGHVEAIVEHRDATGAQRQIREINSGILAFESQALWEYISRLSRGNSQSEYYLTDLIGLLAAAGRRVCAYCVDDPWEVTGINSPEQLSELERIFRQREDLDSD